MANKNNFITGITDLLVLGILYKNDSYVYEITKTINSQSKGLLDISQNTIYTATYKLEEANLISEYSKLVGKKRTRVYYHIEPEGEKYYKKILSDYQNITLGVKNMLDSLSEQGGQS